MDQRIERMKSLLLEYLPEDRRMNTGLEGVSLVRRDRPYEPVPHVYKPQISRVINIIHEDISPPLEVQALAREAGMSPSSFHANFRAFTSASPFQLITCPAGLPAPGADPSQARNRPWD